MKKIIITIILLCLTGCSSDVQFGSKKSIEEKETKTKKEKMVEKVRNRKSKILSSAVIDICNKLDDDEIECKEKSKVVQYFYKGDTVKKQVRLLSGDKLKKVDESKLGGSSETILEEDISMRTSNALFFPLSNGDIKAEIYLANRYYLDGDVWVDIEYSTTTVDIYKEEVDNSISSSTAVLLDLLGIYVVNADTGTFYPNTGDGVIGNNGASNWADSISADSGTITIYSTTSERDSLSIYNNKYLWRVRRAFYSIDTSSIGSSATISDSDFIFTGYRNSSASLFDAYLVEQEQASDTTLVASDFTTVKRTVSGGHVTLSTDSTWTELTIETSSKNKI